MADQHEDDPNAERHDETWPGVAAAYAAWPSGAPVIRQIPPPQERLDPRARTIWLLNNLIATAIIMIPIVAIAIGLGRWTDISRIWTFGTPLVLLIVQLVVAWIDPLIRYRQWRFEIREDEVDLKHGLITHTRQVVPMSRIQHVDTRQGPIERRYGLASVIFYTAAGSMEIPALSVERAGDVRNQIAALAKVHDDL